MASENDITSSQTTAPLSPKVGQTVDQILGGVQGVLKAGPKPFKENLYTAPSAATKSGWSSALTAANNPGYKAGIGSAMDFSRGLIDKANTPGLYEEEMMGTARGDMLGGSNPYFEANLARGLDDAGAGVNASIGAGGRYGSGAHVNQLAETLGGLSTSARGAQYETERDRQIQALTGISGERQQSTTNAMQGSAALPGLFSASLLPSQTTAAVGSSMDANNQAAKLGRADLWDRTQNAKTNQLAQLASILSGTAQSGGSTTTSTEPQAPWWSQLLGAGAIGSGIYGNIVGAGK